MVPTWRWFGPKDPISLAKIRQAGARGIVTALHELPVGEAWPLAALEERKAMIEEAGLSWPVVESLPVHSAIRLDESDSDEYVGNYLESLQNLGKLQIKTVCYNFMPVIDWTRTQLHWKLEDGSEALRFDNTDWIAFDVFILKRSDADQDYTQAQISQAEQRFQSWNAGTKAELIKNIASGLPGANEHGLTLEELRAELERWSAITPQVLRDHLVKFLDAVVPTAERWGIRMCMHPDDPPRPLLGLPRIASCEQDFETLFSRVPSPANGLTLCVGSLGAGPNNSPSRIAQRFGDRIGFAHLRVVKLEQDGSFVEAEHLSGDTDLVEIVQLLVQEERRRSRGSNTTTDPIYVRPDHGHTLEGDVTTQPGYPWLGRLKALSEIRGVMHAVEKLTR